MRKISKVCIILLIIMTLSASCHKQEEPVTTETTAAPSTTVRLPAEDDEEGIDYRCPVDFSKYRSTNREVYAYIHIPNTNIDYPILQSGISDNYYLRRNWKGGSSYRGCIFTQSGNAKDFYDPITVVYGHNTDRKDMFSELLYFQDKEFFDKNDKFYIYTEDRILVYKIISAHTYDDRHILNSYDFGDEAVLLSFQNDLLNPASIKRNVRDGIELDASSNIVILSTCAEPHSGATTRFLVNGVLIKDVEAF